MMHIKPEDIADAIPSGVAGKLEEATTEIHSMSDDDTKEYIKKHNIWTDARPYLERVSNRKCWYTESLNRGCHNDVDHFRPKGEKTKDGERLYWYWFEAYSVENFRLSCHFSNRVTVDWEMQEKGEGGGKGSHFPLCNSGMHAINRSEVGSEEPMLLDPCRAGDSELIAFLPDGRAVASPMAASGSIERERVDQSTHLLNLNFPTFNEDREALYNSIRKWVNVADAVEDIQIAFEAIKELLEELTARESAYSSAARCFLRFFRDREWVNEIVESWSE